MKDNIIEFLYPKDTKLILKHSFPIPATQKIPEWYKKLKHTALNKTIKGCMPVLDCFSAGYILRMPQDLYIHHNYTNGEKKDSSSHAAFSMQMEEVKDLKLNVNTNFQRSFHPIDQVGGKKGGCPFVEKNSNLPFYKITNPFRIKTAPGYSCLFTPPLNNRDDRFEIKSGIVDTDTFPTYINFPIIINGDKYPILDTVIKQGTPYAQVIPFKRQNWKMQIKEERGNLSANTLSIVGKIIHNYKTYFWNKKSWK